MPRPIQRFFLFAIFLFAAAAELYPAPFDIRGRVVGVQDGDSITVLDSSYVQYKVRLAGIDAPEKKQAFGAASKRSLSALVYDRFVEVHVTKTDRYGRYVAKVTVGGTDVCLAQIRAGMAWFYADYQKELSPADREMYLAAHRAALAARSGLWADAAPIPPWQYRRLRRH